MPSAATTLLMRAYLALTFCWVGLAYLIIFWQRLKEWPEIIASVVACLAVGVLFALDIFTMKMVFKLPQTTWQIYVSLLLMIWGWILYPSTGWVIGHRYPRVSLFGVVLCPTTIFAIGLLTAVVSNRVEMIALFILSLLAILAAVRTAIRGYDGERVYETLFLPLVYMV